MTEKTMKIEGMSCGGCVAGVASALDRVGVTKHEVEVGRAKIEYDEAEISTAEIIEAIQDAGFDVAES